MATTQIIDLLSIEIGTEVTWGTNVVPTALLQGAQEFGITPLTEVMEFPSLQGLAPAYDVDIVKTGGEATMTGLVLYEDLPFWLDSLIRTVSPTGVGPYVYLYEPELNTCPTRSSYTLVYGDSSDAYALNGSVVSTMTISGSASEALNLDLEFVGKNVVADSLVGISARTVNIATSAETVISMADFGAGWGAVAAIPCTAFDFELEINSNTSLIYAIGSIDACDYFGTRWEGSLSLTLEFPGDSDITKNILASYIGTSPSLVKKLIQIESTQGTNVITFDFAGVLAEAPEIFTDNDGVLTLELEFTGLFNTDFTNDNWLNVSVTNGVATLP